MAENTECLSDTITKSNMFRTPECTSDVIHLDTDKANLLFLLPFVKWSGFFCIFQKDAFPKGVLFYQREVCGLEQ